MYFLIEGSSFKYFKGLIWVVYFASVVNLCVSFFFTYSPNKTSKKTSGCSLLAFPSFNFCKYYMRGTFFCKSGSFFYYFPYYSDGFCYWYFWQVMVADTFD